MKQRKGVAWQVHFVAGRVVLADAMPSQTAFRPIHFSSLILRSLLLTLFWVLPDEKGQLGKANSGNSIGDAAFALL